MHRPMTWLTIFGSALLVAGQVRAAIKVTVPPAKAPAAAAQAEAVPQAKAPKPPPRVEIAVREALKLGSQLIPAGRYEVKRLAGAQGVDIVLFKDGFEVVRELSVKPYEQPRKPATAVWARRDTREEKALRVFSQEGLDLRFAVFPLGS